MDCVVSRGQDLSLQAVGEGTLAFLGVVDVMRRFGSFIVFFILARLTKSVFKYGW
jgi:hypothetical protein